MLEKVLKSTKLFPFQKKTKFKKLIKMAMKILQQYLTKEDLLAVLDLWEVHYQIFWTISAKEFTKLNSKIAMVLLNTKVSTTI